MNSGTDTHPRVLVSAFLDGELGPHETALVEAHLAGCPSCRELLEEYRVIAASTASLTTPPVAADLRARINHHLDAATGPGTGRPSFRPRSYRLALGAAAGVVLVLGFWILRQKDAPDRGAHPSVAQPGTESTPPSSAAKTTGSASVADARRDGPDEVAGLPGASGHWGGSAQPQGSRNSSAASDRLDLVAPGANKEGSLEREPAVAQQRALRPAAPEGVAVERQDETDEAWAPAPRSQERPRIFSGPGAAVPPSASAPLVPPRLDATGRTLRFEFPDHVISLSEDGTLSLSSGQYACIVRSVQANADREVARLFSLASQQNPAATGVGSAGASLNVPGTSVITLQDGRASAKRAGRRGSTREIDPAAVVEMNTRLRVLMKDSYIGLLESRCGPLPPGVQYR